jgi:hypothetical protein
VANPDEVYDWANDDDLESFGLKIETVQAIDLTRGMAIVDHDGIPALAVTHGANLADCPKHGAHLFVVVEEFGRLFHPLRFILNPDEPFRVLTGA